MPHKKDVVNVKAFIYSVVLHTYGNKQYYTNKSTLKPRLL